MPCSLGARGDDMEGCLEKGGRGYFKKKNLKLSFPFEQSNKDIA